MMKASVSNSLRRFCCTDSDGESLSSRVPIGLAIDLSSKTEEYPWLIDPINYSRCQEVGKRIGREGHPLLRVRSARHTEGHNIIAFKSNVLSNVREHCYLNYSLDVNTFQVTVVAKGNTHFTLDMARSATEINYVSGN